MTETVQFRVSDFDCPTCADTVERALNGVDGVEHAVVHYTTGRIEIDYDADLVAPEAFEQHVRDHGYTPTRA